ncbi:MAG TPA: NTP transferase domain-containing protein [Actinomycetota bacterium]|nr:NTP transferase domain-containing protein [Actinomycetota bacterium]
MMTGRSMAGLVLCGGGSARMRREKALISVSGRPLVLHVARILEQAAAPVLLAPGHSGRLGALGYDEVDDAVPGSGPLGGLLGGLIESPHHLTAVVAVDMPFASAALFTLLAELLRDEDAVVPRTGSGPEPLHAVYSRAALPILRSALADRELALHMVLSRLRVRWVDQDEWATADPSGRFAVNLNVEGDLALLEGSPLPPR